jgi:hypothetical protein
MKIYIGVFYSSFDFSENIQNLNKINKKKPGVGLAPGFKY